MTAMHSVMVCSCVLAENAGVFGTERDRSKHKHLPGAVRRPVDLTPLLQAGARMGRRLLFRRIPLLLDLRIEPALGAGGSLRSDGGTVLRSRPGFRSCMKPRVCTGKPGLAVGRSISIGRSLASAAQILFMSRSTAPRERTLACGARR